MGMSNQDVGHFLTAQRTHDGLNMIGVIRPGVNYGYIAVPYDIGAGPVERKRAWIAGHYPPNPWRNVFGNPVATGKILVKRYHAAS